MYKHLFNTETDTHYLNGGTFTDHPLPNGPFQWVDGPAPEGATLYKDPSPADNAKALLATLPDEVKAKHYSTINNVRAAIENDEWGVVPHLLADVTPDTPEEATALQQISEALGAN